MEQRAFPTVFPFILFSQKRRLSDDKHFKILTYRIYELTYLGLTESIAVFSLSTVLMKEMYYNSNTPSMSPE